MKENNFVFTDLSTYDISTAKRFYSKVFNWSYFGNDSDYLVAQHIRKEIAGLYETPEKFKEMNMPSFWMSYIQVSNVETTVGLAKDLGGIIELVDLKSSMGKIALIRDPLGAGFTVYEGNQLNSRYQNRKNSLIWNELFVSDVSKVKPFYEGLFDWELNKTTTSKYNIISNSTIIGGVQEVDNTVKGKYEYWGVFFGVEDVVNTQKIVEEQGGTVVYQDDVFTLCTDPFGAMFHLVPLKENQDTRKRTLAIKWKALTGLGLIGISILTNWNWIWSIFFAVWVISDIKSGQTHMFEPISRAESPTLYWTIVLVWALIGLYSISYYLKPEWFTY